MTESSRNALRVEQEFLAAAEANLAVARERRLLPGVVFDTGYGDASESVHRAMVDRRMYGERVKHSVPQGRRLITRGYARRFLIGKRLSSVTVASVFSPPGPLLDGGAAAPVTVSELATHVRELVAGREGGSVPRVVAVCSPGGFSDDAWNTRIDVPNTRVILVAPRGDGGWRVAAAGGTPMDDQLLRLFDPEGVSEKLRRVRRALDENSAELLLGGVSATSLARRLEVPLRMVELVFQNMSRADPELRTSRSAGELMLLRGAPAPVEREGRSMSLGDRIRAWFGGKQDEAKTINMLIERRGALAQRRDRVYEDIAKLEKREQSLMDEGRANTSEIVRRRLASQVSQLRKELARWNTTASMLNQQINVISTDIHNLTLLQQGRMAQLPAAEELTEHAVAAEEMLETLATDAKLVDGLEVGLAEAVISDDEAEILKEFEAPAVASAKSPEPARKVAGPVERNLTPPVAEPPAGERSKRQAEA